MAEQQQFTIEQAWKWANQGKIMGGKCRKCGKIHYPPRPLCDSCFSNEFEWIEVSPKGKLLTYTIIHIAPTQFQQMTPYIVGIIQLENDLRIPGMIKETPIGCLEVGIPLRLVFEPCVQTQQWPRWPRYHFRTA